MPNYWSLKKESYFEVAYLLKRNTPALKDISAIDIEEGVRRSGVTYLRQVNVTAPWWMRLTLPFAMILIIVLIICSPIKFIITGRWSYNWVWVTNWFKSLGF